MSKVIEFINGNKIVLSVGSIGLKLVGHSTSLPSKLECISASQLGKSLESYLGTAIVHSEVSSNFVEQRIKLTSHVRLDALYSSLTDTLVSFSLVDTGKRRTYKVTIPRLRVVEIDTGTGELIDEIFTDNYDDLLSELVELVVGEEELIS